MIVGRVIRWRHRGRVLVVEWLALFDVTELDPDDSQAVTPLR